MISALSRLQHLLMVIPADENVCLLETDDAITGR